MYLMKPGYSFVIQVIQEKWHQNWGAKCSEITPLKMCSDPPIDSGGMVNSGNIYFLKLSANAVHTVENQSDMDGILYVRRAIMCWPMVLNLNGTWEKKPRLTKLQKKFRSTNFTLPGWLSQPTCFRDGFGHWCVIQSKFLDTIKVSLIYKLNSVRVIDSVDIIITTYPI